MATTTLSMRLVTDGRLAPGRMARLPPYLVFGCDSGQGNKKPAASATGQHGGISRAEQDEAGLEMGSGTARVTGTSLLHRTRMFGAYDSRQAVIARPRPPGQTSYDRIAEGACLRSALQVQAKR